MEQPFIISVAPNGARRTKKDHPRLPVTPAELAECAKDIAGAGAALLHLHVREDDEGHSLDPGRYREAIAAVREATGDALILQASTEATGRYELEEQLAVVRALDTEAISFALRELCPTPADEPAAREFCHELCGRGVMTQYILYEPAEVARFERLRQDGFFGEERPFALFVLGRYGQPVPAAPELLLEFLGAAPDMVFPWSVCSFGPREEAAALLAARTGGHARLGFENNLWLADGSLAPDNAALVRQLLPGLALAGRRPATAAEARAILRGKDAPSIG